MKGGLQILYVHTAIVKIQQHKNIIQYHIIFQHCSSGLLFLMKIQNYILYRSCSTQFVNTFTISIQEIKQSPKYHSQLNTF